MDPGSRYEILDVIAQGDFGRVCRARDRALGREVAVKQIHPHFLQDQRQLARFWQEAQLLATLQHPNIINIYDVDRQRGWLIVELMRGNLEQFAHGQPIDLEFLRVALGGCLNALQFLHANGVIHGDVKPSNILLDAQGRVKLGDFGLARRANSEGGSLLKGTTKYMAPELVSNQFGAVGPASDLYSLGFSAYELMCGSQFEALFPGLSGFGRDRQIAWMMWHAAPDRAMPEVQRVLEGVPPDLARVVQRMVVKDQARRYQTAADVLRDLRTDLMTAPPVLQPQEDAVAIEAEVRAQQKKRRTRLMAIGAVAISALMCLVLFLPKKQPPVAAVHEEEAPAGYVLKVYPDEHTLDLKLDVDGKAKELKLREYDRVFINNESRPLRDVLPDDHVTIRQMRDAQGRRVLEVYATRPIENAGTIKEIKPDEDQLTLLTTDSGAADKELVVVAPSDTAITFNGQDKIDGEPVKLQDLQVDDRVVMAHEGEREGQGRRAVWIKAERIVTEEGVVRDVDAKKKTLTLAVGAASKQKTIVLPYADNCEVSVNKQLALNDRRIKPSDLIPGDKAVVAHDVRITRIDAHRILGEAGVIQRVQLDSHIIDVVKEGESRATSYQVDGECKVTLGGETVDLSQLRQGDAVDITHDTPGAKVPHATSVAATRSADRNRWAIVIANQNFDDVLVTRLSHPIADAKMITDALTTRYQVPADQCLALTDESRVRLEQSIPDRLRRLSPDAKIVVYVAGHAYKTDDGVVFLAPKNFDQKHAATTGLALQWLVDVLEECPAGEKLLLLDCSQSGDDADLKAEPSTAEMLRSLKGSAGRAALRTVTAIASCKPNQRGLVLDAGAGKGHGLFAWVISEAFRGAADKNRDSRIEPTELFGYLGASMPALAKAGSVQTPELFLPDMSEPRLSEEAKASIRKLAALLRQDKVDETAIEDQYLEAASLAGKEGEPKLLYGMLLLKDRQRDKEKTLKVLEELKIEQPKAIVPLEGIAWLRFTARRYKNGIDDLIELIQRMPKPKKAGQPYSEEALEAFAWVGRLREFCSSAEEGRYQPAPQSLTALDAVVSEHPAEAVKAYQEGRDAVKAKLADFDRQISQSVSDADTAKLKLERRRLVNYAAFPFIKAASRVLAGLKD